MGRELGLDIDSSSNLLFQQPADSIIRDDVMKERESAEYPTCRGCASLKKPPGREAEEKHLDQKADDPRDTDPRRATVPWHAEHTPDCSGKQRQTNGQEGTQQALMLSPSPIAHTIQGGKLQKESKRKVDRVLSHANSRSP